MGVGKRYDSMGVSGPFKWATNPSAMLLDKVPDRIGAGRTSTGQVRERVTLAVDDHITCYHESTVLVKINLREISKLLAGQGLADGKEN